MLEVHVLLFIIRIFCFIPIYVGVTAVLLSFAAPKVHYFEIGLGIEL